MRTAFLIVTFTVCVAMFGLIGLMALSEQAEDDAVPVVEVHGTVTGTTSRPAPGRGGGSIPIARFRTDDGESGAVEGRTSTVGERITVYRYGSGDYEWKSTQSWFIRWISVPMFALAAVVAVAGATQVRGSIGASRARRRRRSAPHLRAAAAEEESSSPRRRDSRRGRHRAAR
ncbi:hypothetical protein [Brachybacterium sp. ACRRE]|uniref:hypothetical protein n=1 Tax=Brachybacterium sp. ACRRE TaxID=2918184 RepID=UPI001EF1A95D|nr:hypothetical protein [Brachybacterium sp. ACRRE]MCG7307925.1 hypothetical protein [Brachybacterium sp. ACRRE]